MVHDVDGSTDDVTGDESLLVAASPDGTPLYGGVWRVSVDGVPVADFVPSAQWDLTLRSLL